MLLGGRDAQWAAETDAGGQQEGGCIAHLERDGAH